MFIRACGNTSTSVRIFISMKLWCNGERDANQPDTGPEGNRPHERHRRESDQRIYLMQVLTTFNCSVSTTNITNV